MDDRTKTLNWSRREGDARAVDSGAPLPERIGDYRIVRRIGEGGMGVVYEAEQPNPRRAVALKLIRGGQFVDPVHVKMFQREVETLGRLEHPSIAAIYESGCTADGQNFFAMELVRGETLTEWLKRQSQDVPALRDLPFRLSLFRKICSAVAYAHQRGVIHRDIKPSNILVTERTDVSTGSSSPGVPEIKILDFGLARITESDVERSTVVTQVSKVQGTLQYMSPEQVRGASKEIDLRTDVYSLGVVLYEMLTGKLPYDIERASLPEAARAICEDPPTPLTRVWSGRRKPSRDLATIVLKALEKEPARRYQSVSALAEDIDRYLADQPILARPPSATYQLKKLISRHRLLFSASVMILALIVGFAITMFFMFRVQREERRQADTQRTEVERMNQELRGILDSLKAATLPQSEQPSLFELDPPESPVDFEPEPTSPRGVRLEKTPTRPARRAPARPRPGGLSDRVAERPVDLERVSPGPRGETSPVVPPPSGTEAPVLEPAVAAATSGPARQLAGEPPPQRTVTTPLMLVNAFSRRTAAQIHIVMGEYAEAEVLLLECYRTILDAPVSLEEKRSTLQMIVRMYELGNKDDQAAEFRELLSSVERGSFVLLP